MAAWALGEQGRREAVPALCAVAGDHDDALCREAAVAALGAIGDEAGLAVILAATSDKPAVRRRAVLALAPFDGPEVDAALRRALTDRDWQVRQAAEDLLPND
jgi:HEAT repeat protein